MHEHIIIGIGSIIILGIAAQWIGWRLKLPAILPLLVVGFLAGPVTGFINPDELIGDLLFPVVSISVAVILFEGGLSLKREDLAGMLRVVQLLISVGVLITWAGIWAAAYFIFGLDPLLSSLLGAILVVSGPTVVTPLLRFIRPVNRVRSVLQWEGILVDPVGATLGVLVLGAVAGSSLEQLSIPIILAGIVLTLVIGGLIGWLASSIIIQLFQREWVPEYLQTAVTLLLVMLAFIASNVLRAESGLMATTVMGIVLANQKRVNIQHVVSFKEELGILLLSVLFIVLSARIELTDFAGIGWEATLFLAVLLFVIRPISVWVSTIRSDLSWKEKLFLSWMYPRGIVAASVASLFALELHDLGFAGSERLVPLTFLVVVGTVAVYALTAGPLARVLELVRTNPQGTLIVGAHGWAREIATALTLHEFDVVLVDTNPANVRAAQIEGLSAIYGSILSDAVIDQLPIARLGHMIALTKNSELNALAGMAMESIVGEGNVSVLISRMDGLSDVTQQILRSHCLFGVDTGYDFLQKQFDEGAFIKTDLITDDYSFDDFLARNGETAVPMFVIDGDTLQIGGAECPLSPKPGNKLLSLVNPRPNNLPSSLQIDSEPTLN
jgi:NhaP-type Na+/H+ or K+/H+ antiporter